MGNDSIGGVVDVGGGIGSVAGKGGQIVGNFVSNLSLYISNMGITEWILLCVLVFGGFIVWHLKNKYNLKFRWGPKKPKRTFN